MLKIIKFKILFGSGEKLLKDFEKAENNLK